LALVDRFKAPKAPSPQDELYLELRRQDTIQLATKFAWLHSPRNGQMQLMFHNIQSLEGHLDLVRSDNIYLKSDILLFVETWSKHYKEYPVTGFTMASRADCDGNLSKAMGSCCYVADHLRGDIGISGSTTNRQNGSVVSVSWVTVSGILIASIYACPSTNVSMIIETLDPIITVLLKKIFVGDFNVNTLVPNRQSQELVQFFFDNNMTSAIPSTLPTTAFNTQIDNIFTSFPIISSGHYFSISPSPHIPLYLRF
jgi:hypothetical protein